jgi:hypothetical protein
VRELDGLRGEYTCLYARCWCIFADEKSEDEKTSETCEKEAERIEKKRDHE